MSRAMNRMMIVITDSGLGGLVVAAKLFEWLNEADKIPPIDIIFANALLEPRHGYNTMPDTGSKIRIFNKVLYGIKKNFDPHLIGIACNTLSAILPETQFFNNHKSMLVSIIDISIQNYLQMENDVFNSPIIIFGTETTILSRAYKNSFIKAGISRQLIIQEICSQLASEIENDYQSRQTQRIIENCVENAIRKIEDKNKKIHIYLACTHYGYVAHLFVDCLKKAGCRNLRLIDPNDYLIQAMKDEINKLFLTMDRADSGKAEISVFSRCQILPEEISSISKLLIPVSTQIVEALKRYEIKEDLFNLS